MQGLEDSAIEFFKILQQVRACGPFSFAQGAYLYQQVTVALYEHAPDHRRMGRVGFGCEGPMCRVRRVLDQRPTFTGGYLYIRSGVKMLPSGGDRGVPDAGY